MELFEALSGRRSVRRFRQLAVPEPALRKMIDMARRGSCGGNRQLLRYIVVRTPETVRNLFEQTAWAALVKPRRTPRWGKDAPLCFIAVTAPAANAGIPIVHADAGCAIQSMQLAAFAQQLGCCWIGAFNQTEAARILELPPERAVLYLLAVGFPAEEPVFEEAPVPEMVKYYLDDEDRLHVPKLRIDDVAQWR